MSKPSSAKIYRKHAELLRRKLGLKGAKKFKAREAEERKAGGAYHGITRTVTRDSKRVLYDFQPPFLDAQPTKK